MSTEKTNDNTTENSQAESVGENEITKKTREVITKFEDFDLDDLDVIESKVFA